MPTLPRWVSYAGRQLIDLGAPRPGTNDAVRMVDLEATAGEYAEKSLLQVNAADSRFGTARNTAQIQAAIDAVKAAGGGSVRISKADGPWTISRRVPGEQALGGLWIDSSNVTLEFDGTVFNLTDNCHFIKIASTVGAQVAITADTSIDTATLAVASSAAFAVGQWVFVRLGQAAYDAFEPDWWLYAKVQAIPDGTSVTLDRPTGYAMSVASTPAIAQRSIAPITSFVENVAIRGSVNLVNPMAGGANAEAGISVQIARNITIEDVSGFNPGAGTVLLQFVDGARVGAVKSWKSLKQNGQSSKGRVLNLGECRNITVGQVFAEDFEGMPILTEARCLGVSIGEVLLNNNNATRNNETTGLIGMLGNNEITINHFTLLGKGSYLFDTGGSTGNDLRIREAYFYADAKPTLAQLSVITDRLTINTVTLNKRRVWRRLIPLTTNMFAAEFYPPKGYLCRTSVYASTVTGITSFYLGSSTENSPDLSAQLVAESVVDLNQGAGFGSGYRASEDTTKKIIVYTDGTLPTGAYLVVEMDYFEDPENVSAAAIEQAFPTTLPSLKIDGSVGFYGTTPIAKQTLAAEATDAATTQALVNDIRAKLIALGLVT